MPHRNKQNKKRTDDKTVPNKPAAKPQIEIPQANSQQGMIPKPSPTAQPLTSPPYFSLFAKQLFPLPGPGYPTPFDNPAFVAAAKARQPFALFGPLKEEEKTDHQLTSAAVVAKPT